MQGGGIIYADKGTKNRHFCHTIIISTIRIQRIEFNCTNYFFSQRFGPTCHHTHVFWCVKNFSSRFFYTFKGSILGLKTKISKQAHMSVCLLREKGSCNSSKRCNIHFSKLLCVSSFS